MKRLDKLGRTHEFWGCFIYHRTGNFNCSGWEIALLSFCMSKKEGGDRNGPVKGYIPNLVWSDYQSSDRSFIHKETQKKSKGKNHPTTLYQKQGWFFGKIVILKSNLPLQAKRLRKAMCISTSSCLFYSYYTTIIHF